MTALRVTSVGGGGGGRITQIQDFHEIWQLLTMQNVVKMELT